MALCGACGGDISEQNRFCPACGVPVASDTFATRTVAVFPTPRRTPSSAAAPKLRSSSSRSVHDGRFAPGAVLADRYRIVALLGKGGMGEVYRADDLALDQQVALKLLPESLSENPEAIARFRNEVRTARQVSHPNVCRVYDLTEIDGLYVLSMEYVDGEDLGSLLRRIGRLPVDKALEISHKLCAGLAAAHEKGVLHRDLKPANVMLDGRGQVLLTDFGLAGIAGEIEGAEVRNGTPAYMAPEQLAGLEVTVKSDIYSLGLVLYEIFTGKLPFESDTLAGLIRARAENAPASPTTLVRDLDPAVEKVILRSLQAKPSLRPASALSVAAALPGGDRLAAALAAGETPSPEMVAEAGEGQGLSPKIAIPLFAALLLAFAINGWWALRRSALDQLRPPYPPEVLAQKSRDLVKSLGYNDHPVDSMHKFDWNDAYTSYAEKHGDKNARWQDMVRGRPSPLHFWYRQAESSLFVGPVHDDWLTPGLVDLTDPPMTEAGMVTLVLDERGRLTRFEAIPRQRIEGSPPPAAAPDWAPLFSAAALDPAQLKPAEPEWNWLGSPDTRAAWTGTWPGSKWPLRVEAAAYRGKPVAFMLFGPWTKPWREQGSGSTPGWIILLSVLVVVILCAAPVLARRNLREGRADRRGATRLAIFTFCVLMGLWLTTGHLMASIAGYGEFLLAVATSLAYGLALWTVYLAAEPFVRRRWPQTLISWTTVVSGKVNDAVVGRDVLIGVSFGSALLLIDLLLNVNSTTASFRALAPLNGFRGALGLVFSVLPQGIRGALIYLLLICLFRVVLRNQWLAGAAFTLLFASLNYLQSSNTLAAVGTSVVYGVLAVMMLRWGALAVCTGVSVGNLMELIPFTSHPDDWFVGSSIFLVALIVALGAWATRTAMAGRRVFKKDLLE
jgi:serine/threonine protein kinase